jgi:Inner membrane component of T3SS, cytoplasmic domain
LRSLNSSPTRMDARDSRSGGPTDSDRFPALEICRGRTEHPLRPIETERFLIGSSPRCDLQLGGAEMPALHSLIVLDGGEMWLEAVAPAPAIEVNGRAESSVQLAHGDRIRIGGFEFLAHVPQRSASVSAPLDEEFGSEAVAEEEVGELSAAELVERIEAATQLVNDFEERQRLGLEAMLNNAAQLKRDTASTADDAANEDSILISESADESDNQMVRDLEALVVQLSGVVGQLEKQSGAQWRREVGYFDAVSSLFETQDRLSRQLEILLRRVASLNADRVDRQPNRAIA